MANPFAAEASGAVSTKADAPGNPFGAQSNSKPSSRKGSSSVEANPFGAPPAAGSKAKTKAKAKKKGTYSSGKASTSKPGSKASSRKSSTKQPPIEETLNIPDGHMARIDSNAISVLKSTDAIQVRGSELAEDGDDDTPVAPVSDRRSTVAARSQAVAGRDDPGSAGVYASTLRRTFTLSNKSQLEVMKLVKDKQMTVEEALAFAAQKEEQEASLSLSNEAQLQLLMSVKSGQMTQEEAVEQARQQSKAEAAKQTERERVYIGVVIGSSDDDRSLRSLPIPTPRIADNSTTEQPVVDQSKISNLGIDQTRVVDQPSPTNHPRAVEKIFESPIDQKSRW
eukprot:m.101632 g.101632  ORF g.101632 m.101632 type:complete len:338 (+) comp15178_c0_seq3:87-1100(+)